MQFLYDTFFWIADNYTIYAITFLVWLMFLPVIAIGSYIAIKKINNLILLIYGGNYDTFSKSRKKAS